jgi:hypothetical protein
MSQTTLNYGVKPPIGQRINFRMLTIILVFAFLVGYPVVTFIKAQMNHGVEHDGDLFRVDLKSMGNFVFDGTAGTIDNIPAQFRALDGKEVALEGFMWTGNSSAPKVPSFQFVYNVTKCCFSGPPLVQERVFAYVPDHEQVEYHNDECRIIGTLHVKVEKDDAGKISSVYTIDVKRVESL